VLSKKISKGDDGADLDHWVQGSAPGGGAQSFRTLRRPRQLATLSRSRLHLPRIASRCKSIFSTSLVPS
jgi:hypothetical protein